jgi:hypothetical protein
VRIKTDDTSSMMVVRRSILAMLYGKYVANGKIDLGKTVKELGIMIFDSIYKACRDQWRDDRVIKKRLLRSMAS